MRFLGGAGQTLLRLLGVDVAQRGAIDFIPAGGIGITVVDDPANNEVDVTIDGSGLGGGPHTHPFTDVTGTESDAQHGVRTQASAHGHGDLSGVTADQHHAQAHTLASHSTKTHAELTAIGADDHHAQIHAAQHQPGGGDTMAVDAVAATGSLRTLGAGAQQATAGNDSRLSDARTPLAHSGSVHTEVRGAVPRITLAGSQRLNLGADSSLALLAMDVTEDRACQPTLRDDQFHLHYKTLKLNPSDRATLHGRSTLILFDFGPRSRLVVG